MRPLGDDEVWTPMNGLKPYKRGPRISEREDDSLQIGKAHQPPNQLESWSCANQVPELWEINFHCL